MIYYIISNITIVPWLFVPYTQRKSKYFYYFLILASVSFISNVMLYIDLSSVMLFMMPSAVLLIPSFNKDVFSKWRYGFLATGVVLIFVSMLIDNYTIQLISLFAFIVGLFIVCYQVYYSILSNSSINIVWVVLVIYQLSLVLKYIPFLKDINHGIVMFYFTTIFQMFIGIFFLLAKEDNPKFIKSI